MKKRNPNISYLRAVACLAIVFFHTFQAAGASLGGVDETAAAAAAGTLSAGTAGLAAAFVTGRNLCLWAVPCFVLVTGALTLSPRKEISIGRLFKRYIWRVLRALLIFSAVYEVIDIAAGIISPANLVTDWLVRVVTGTSWSPLWYLYMMIGLYLLLPAFRAAAAGLSRRTLTGGTIAFYIPVYTVYPLYLFAGCLFSTMPAPGRRGRAAAVLIVIASAAVIGACTLGAFFSDTQVLRAAVSDYSFFPVAALAGAIFCLFIWRKGEAPSRQQAAAGAEAAERKASPFAAFLLAVDRASFGIYLVHIIFVNLVFEVFAFSPAALGPAGGFLSTVALAIGFFFASFLLVTAFNRVTSRRSEIIHE